MSDAHALLVEILSPHFDPPGPGQHLISWGHTGVNGRYPAAKWSTRAARLVAEKCWEAEATKDLDVVRTHAQDIVLAVTDARPMLEALVAIAAKDKKYRYQDLPAAMKVESWDAAFETFVDRYVTLEPKLAPRRDELVAFLGRHGNVAEDAFRAGRDYAESHEVDVMRADELMKKRRAR